MANLADYQAAAASIYEPLLSADIGNETAASNANVANLEAEKGQVATDYKGSMTDLANTVQDQSAQIQQKYTEALGGNFTGLEGNDLGQMFSRANQQQAIIAETRDNKLGQISTAQTNEKNTLNAKITGLKSSYQSKELDYAQSSYGAALKAEQDQADKDRAYQLSVAQFGESQRHNQATEAISGANAANTASNMYQAKAKSGGGFAYTGPNGQALNLGMYAKSVSSNGADALKVIKNQLQASNTSTDKAALAYFNSQYAKYKGNFNQVIGALSNKKEFASLFNGM